MGSRIDLVGTFERRFGAHRLEDRGVEVLTAEGADAVAAVVGSQPCGPQHTGGCCSSTVVELAFPGLAR